MIRQRFSLLVALVTLAALFSAVPAQSVGPLRFDNFSTDHDGGEPTVAVLRDGSILTQAMHLTLRSTNGGRSWKEVHAPPSGGTTLDPYIHADPVTGRILASQLLGACQMLSLSDDEGETWLDLPTQCPSGDHQKIGSGPWPNAEAPRLYPRMFYTCLNHVGDTACSVSHDGGVTWGPLVVVFPGVDPAADQGVSGVPGLCGGLEGDPVSGPDGEIYLPREYCGRPYLAISKDEGLTWDLNYVASPAQTRPIAFGANNPSVSVDAKGTIFYAWTGDDWRHYVARSTDGGESWSKPWSVAPIAKSTTFPSIITGRPGAVATAFIGTSESGDGPDAAPKETRWYLYVSYSLNADSASPTWKTVKVTPHPVQIGCVGRHGGACRNGNLLDFIDLAFTPQGKLVISYTDGCVDDCKTAEQSRIRMASVAVQTDGPSFR